MLTVALVLVLLFAAWVVGGWLLDDLAEENAWRAAHPPRSNPEHVDTIRLPTGGIFT